MKKLFAVVLSISALSSVTSITLAQKPMATNVTKNLDECISRQKRISALFLIDESKSLKSLKNLPGNDPNDERVPAMKAAARALNSLTRGNKDSAVQVRVAIAGFGESFNTRQRWTNLSDSSLDSVLAVLDKQANRENSLLTRYHVALKGSLESFTQESKNSDTCRILIWFSDGEHDNDDSTGLSPVEKRQITTEICGSDGYADGLRKEGVFVQAVGLNKKPEKMVLMKLVAENSGIFNSGGVSLANCGVRNSSGQFGNASDSSQIVDIITDLPGGTRDEVVTKKCNADASDCSEIKFTVDSSVVSFKVQATRPDAGIDKVVLDGPGGEIELFRSDSLNLSENLDIERLTENKILIDARSTTSKPLTGDWSIRFVGENASLATGRVKFVGEAKVEVLNANNSPVSEIDRFESEPLDIRITTALGASIAEMIEAKLQVVGESQILLTQTKGINQFTVGHSEIERVLQLPAFKESSAVELAVTPVGYVLGLNDAKGGLIPIQYNSIRKNLGVSNGTGLPSFVPEGSDSPLVKFTGTSAGTLKLRFKGPSNTSGSVKFKGVQSEEHSFALTAGETTCDVPREKIITCEVEVKPKSDGYGEVTVPILADLSSKSSSESSPQVIPVRALMSRNANVGKGLTNAILLLMA